MEGFCELLKEVWTREKLPASLALIVHGGTIMALLDAFLRRAVITITSAQMRKDIKDDCLWNLMRREIL